MDRESAIDSIEFKAAYQAHLHQQRINTGRVASALVAFLMPVGVVLDAAVYPSQLKQFLVLRFVCSLLACALWYLHCSPFGQKHVRHLGLPIVFLPALFICCMIYATQGPVSPYYAGLNLILLAVSVVVRWSVTESLVAVGGVFVVYCAACLAKGSTHPAPHEQAQGLFFNNLYFLVLTGIIVVTGNHFFNKLRFREFTLRYELDRNKQQLEQSHQRLVELDQAKSRFFANISHELRTPLTLLLAPLENLLNQFKHALDDRARQLLGTMHSNGMRLLKLINDLLDLVRLDSGVMQVKREAVHIPDFLKGLASAARQVADDKRIRLETRVTEDVGSLLVDRDKLEKIILNLQFNALKFTPAGGRVTLRGFKEADQLVLQVEDTGMGIAAKNLPHVFDRFWQADGSSRRKYQGVGIGLALVKELVEVQGGQVGVDSQEGVGTTFTVRLPYLTPEATPVSDQTPGTDREQEPEVVPTNSSLGGTVSNEEWLAGLYHRAELFPSMTPVQDSVRPVETLRNRGQPKLLVADDEPDMLRFIKSQLAEHYQVLEAVDGQQAIDKATQFLPDVILLDMMMPEKDGLQACKEIRERTPTHNIPIILITARADEETKLAALQAGASDFLPKPFSTTELHVRIRNLVELYQYQRNLARQNQTLESTIEQLKETEIKLVQTEKLASLGRMSAGIIHEINNPLNFTTTGLFTLRKLSQRLDREEQTQYAEVLRDVEEGIQRVKTIVSDLRSFSHHEDQNADRISVSEIVQSALRFLSHEWKDKIRVEQDIQEGLSLWANKNKMIQVLVNLIQNSLDALSSKTFVDESPTLWLHGRVENNRCVLVVRDNGQGIPPEVMDKIFDPFFTTKDVGEGMGLGLSICYRIIQDYEGQISVRSEPGRNCEFKLDFPLRTEPEVNLKEAI